MHLPAFMTTASLLAAGAAAVWCCPVAIGAEATIEATAVISNVRPGQSAAFGGVSDLATAADGSGTLWAVTDRGPNGTIRADGRKLRTLLEPGFVPEILGFEVDRGPDGMTARVGRSIRLRGLSGTSFSGRPNGVGKDEAILDAAGRTPIPPDPNGVDTEAVVQVADGSFWLAEEYRPSLLHVAGDGRVLSRLVPVDVSLEGADTDVRAVLPAHYGLRRDNRGFEALAVSPDGRKLWALLQSPLETGAPELVTKAGNVRLLALDPATGLPLAEHIYRLGDPASDRRANEDSNASDGKLCAMAALDTETLLVIEADDTGLVRLYEASLTGASDTLKHRMRYGEPSIEELDDLAASGIRPLRKALVADLGHLVPAMRHDIYGDTNRSSEAPLKLEGMALLDADRIALVNDNDFGVNVPLGNPCATCLWVIRLPQRLRFMPR